MVAGVVNGEVVCGGWGRLLVRVCMVVCASYL